MKRIGLWHQIKSFREMHPEAKRAYGYNEHETLIELHIRAYGKEQTLAGARGMHISEYIEKCVERMWTLYRLSTFRDWDDCCTKAAVAMSGAPDLTLRRIKTDIPRRNRDKPAKYWMAYRKDWRSDQKRVFWLYEDMSRDRMHRILSNRMRRLERTCGHCGKVTDQSNSWVGVTRRWELSTLFANKETPSWSDEVRRKSTTCIGCWNKLRPTLKAKIESQQIEADIRKLKRTISERKKHDRKDSRLPG